MEEDSGKKGKAVFLYISKVVLITLFFLIVLTTILVSAIGTFSPVTFRNIFRSVGQYEWASVFAERMCEESEKTHSSTCSELCEYSSSLLTAINISSTALKNMTDERPPDNGAVKTVAKRLKSLTEKYKKAHCNELRSADADESYYRSYKDNIEVMSSIGRTNDFVCEMQAYSSVILESSCTISGDSFSELIASVYGAAKAKIYSGHDFYVKGDENVFKSDIDSFLLEAENFTSTELSEVLDEAISLKLCYDAAYSMNGAGKMTDYFTETQVSRIYSDYITLIANYNSRS